MVSFPVRRGDSRCVFSLHHKTMNNKTDTDLAVTNEGLEALADAGCGKNLTSLVLSSE